jgi:multiple sugar transport system permease protein
MMTMKLKTIPKRAVFVLLVLLCLLFILTPFIWQFLTSIKPPAELYKMPPQWIPSRLHTGYYVSVFTAYPFARYLMNSAIVAGSTTILNLILASMCAYALARLKFKGAKFLPPIILIMSMFPAISALSPVYILLRDLRLTNTYFGLIVPYTIFSLPFAIWILINFFKTVPRGLEEAAAIDGCSWLRIIYSVILPLAAPGIFTSALLTFINAWNEYLFALTFMSSNNMRTVTVGIAMFPGLYEYPWGDIAAASIIVTVPLIILVLFCQKYIVSGLTSGGIKE